MTHFASVTTGREAGTGNPNERNRRSCSHCGLDVPSGLIEVGNEHQFCCNGCRTAWTVIHDCGLEAWYRIAERGRAVNCDDAPPPESFDVPGFLDRYAIRNDTGEISIVLAIEGIHCAACVWLIERLDRVCPGVTGSTVNFARRTVTVRWQDPDLRLSQVVRGLQGLGYRVSPVTPGRKQINEDRENRQHLLRLGIAGAAAGNNMLIATAIYLGLFSEMEDSHLWLLRLASCAAGMLSLLWPGRVFFQGAIAAIRTRTPHMDLPVALGLGVGGIAGVVNTILNRGEIYFDSIGMLVFLLLVGRYIQYRQQRRATDSIELLYRMTPSFAWKVDGEAVHQVPAEMLEKNELIEVRAGETVPADGIIEYGDSSLDESILTGESAAVSRGRGDAVAAGTLNLSGLLRVRIAAAGSETRLGRILNLVQEAAGNRPQLVQWADRTGGWFVAAVVIMAAGTYACWWMAGSDAAVDHAVALLIVACPCALALATPLTLAVALGRSAAGGIMIKGGDVLDRMSRPGTLWLDKTGTLTAGKVRVAEWLGDQNVIPAVMAIQSHSSHPIAAAFAVNAMEEFSGNSKFGVTSHLPDVAGVQQLPGLGITGTVADDQYAIGSEQLVEAALGQIPAGWKTSGAALVLRGFSPVFVCRNREIVAVVGVGDRVRPEARSLVNRFRSSGWKVGILSGDHQSIVDTVADQVGIDRTMAFGRQSPEEKVDRIQSAIASSGTVVMVGDGANDSPALAVADVGIAVHSGAHASLQAAPVWLARDGIGEVATLLDTSKRALSTVRLAVVVSLGYNVLAVALAAAGMIHPLAAAALMPVSSLSVVAIALSGAKSCSSR